MANWIKATELHDDMWLGGKCADELFATYVLYTIVVNNYLSNHSKVVARVYNYTSHKMEFRLLRADKCAIGNVYYDINKKKLMNISFEVIDVYTNAESICGYIKDRLMRLTFHEHKGLEWILNKIQKS